MIDTNNDVFIMTKYNEGRSVYEIAEELKTYPNKVRRSLIKNGIKLRSKAEAQANALETGRSTHPTKGKPRSTKDKLKISQRVHESWTDEKREQRSEIAKGLWEKMSDSDKENFYKKAGEGIRKAAKEGSYLEKFLVGGLRTEGFHVEFHREKMIVMDSMQLDLYLPDLKVAIEIDGPSHFLPIWGQDVLDKKIKSDNIKNGLLINAGIVVIRFKNATKSMSQNKMREALTNLLSVLQCIKTKFPDKDGMLINLEIK